MLLRNGSSVSISRIPFSGASFIGAAQAAFGFGALRQFGMYLSPAAVIAGDSINEKSGLPDGYGFEGWFPPIKGGGMSSHREVTGQGDLAAALETAKEMAAALTGSGTISFAELALIVQLAAAIAGSGTVSGALLDAVAALEASLSGSGDVTAASLALIVALASAISGNGALASNLNGYASLEAAITVLGEALTTGNVGDAVWSKLLEAGFDASRILRIIAAATAGASSGGPSGFTARNLGNTKDQITGTADGSGNRAPPGYGT